MDHALGVGISHRLTDFEHHAERTRPCPPFALLIHEIQDRAQVTPLDQLHREVGATRVVDAQLMDGHDPRVDELARDARLIEESPQQLGCEIPRLGRSAFLLAAEDHLHGHGAIQVLVEDPEDDAHSAASDLVLDAIPLPGASLLGQALEYGVALSPAGRADLRMLARDRIVRQDVARGRGRVRDRLVVVARRIERELRIVLLVV